MWLGRPFVSSFVCVSVGGGLSCFCCALFCFGLAPPKPWLQGVNKTDQIINSWISTLPQKPRCHGMKCFHLCWKWTLLAQMTTASRVIPSQKARSQRRAPWHILLSTCDSRSPSLPLETEKGSERHLVISVTDRLLSLSERNLIPEICVWELKGYQSKHSRIWE